MAAIVSATVTAVLEEHGLCTDVCDIIGMVEDDSMQEIIEGAASACAPTGGSTRCTSTSAGNGRGAAMDLIGRIKDKREAAQRFSHAYIEREWDVDGVGLTDARVSEFGFASVAVFYEVYSALHILHLLTWDVDPDDRPWTMKERMQFYVDKVHRFYPDDAMPCVNIGLNEFIRSLKVEHLLDVGL